jgi:predicted ribosome quality control (RQC) complex YloA/Tae2 family protein
MKLKKNMSSTDIKLIVDEVSDLVQDYSIDNIYELNDLYVFRLKGFKPGSKRQISLLVEIGRRLHLTEFKREFPERPSSKCLTFRKFLKNGKIKRLSQLGFDRIVLLEVENLETNKTYTLIIELFGKGNIILIENLKNEVGEKTSNKVIFALWYRIMRDRALLAGKEFIFPPSRGKSFLDATSDDLTQISDQKDEQIVKVLIKNFGISGEVVEEILALANINKKTNFKEVIPECNEKIIKGIDFFKENVKKGPTVILGDEDKVPFTVLPYSFNSVDGVIIEPYLNFNQACDQFFSSNELALESKEEIVYINKIKQYNKMLEKQLSHVEFLRETMNEKKQLGNSITNNAYLIDELFNTILSANKKGISWEEIEEKLTIGKQKEIPSAQIFEQLNPKNKEISINLDGNKVSFDFTKSHMILLTSTLNNRKKQREKLLLH